MKLVKWEDILKPGTPIWTISFFQERRRTDCKYCKGEGTIKIKGEYFECPACKGLGFTLEEKPFKWHVQRPYGDAITRIDIKQTQKEDYYEVMYWVGCNGYPAEKVFTSQNKATRKCNQLNAAIEKEKDQMEESVA